MKYREIEYFIKEENKQKQYKITKYGIIQNLNPYSQEKLTDENIEIVCKKHIDIILANVLLQKLITSEIKEKIAPLIEEIKKIN